MYREHVVILLFLRELQINTRNYKHNAIVYKPQLLRGLKFNGVFFLWYGWPNSPGDVLPQLISGRECVHTLIFLCVLSVGVCACIRWAHSDSPVLWPCVSMSLTVCVLCAPGAGPILSLVLYNGCIYILIWDYLADCEEGFLSVWCMHTPITMPWSGIRKSLRYDFPIFSHFSTANLRRQQVQNHWDRTKTNLGNVTDLLYPSAHKGTQKITISA